MKKTIILFGIILMGIINLNAQDCYTVKEINNKTENPDLSSKRFTFGIKQMTEELLGEKFTICLDGKPVVVNIISIAKLSVKATFAELKDENLPFEKSVFASAIKKSLQDGISKI